MDSSLNAELSRLNVRKKALYGSHRISLPYLQPEDCPENPRQLDSENVARLIKNFELEGCLRLDPTHYVPALISREHFSSIAQDTATDPPTLTPCESLIYLHGRHRIEAARKLFHSSDWWCVVDLYCEGQFVYHASSSEDLLIISRRYQ